MTPCDPTATIIALALAEDAAKCDITTSAILSTQATAKAAIIAKSEMILSGLDLARSVFHHVDPTLICTTHKLDGNHLSPGDILAILTGQAKSILAAERVALNFLQHLCGIATLTSQFVNKVQGYNVQIVDTRKTTPGLRLWEKAAVRDGGGNNHRSSLAEAYLIKSNHIGLAGSLAQAWHKVCQHNCDKKMITVEVSNLEACQEARKFSPPRILFDNMSPGDIRQAVQLVKGRTETEASGGITLANVVEFAKTGVDRLAIGALTHSAPASDLHLKFEMAAP